MRFCAACKTTYPPEVVVCPKDGEHTGEQKIHDPFLGKLAGSYKIVERLGEGGMGYVYRAEHATLQKQVALKIVRPELAQKKELVDRFLAEAKTISLLNNENIVSIHDIGLLDGEVPYFVMELLEGESLAQRLAREQKLPPKEAIQIIRQLLDALSAAHKHQIVHRDLKPDNVFLVRRKGELSVKLLDFGIAKFLDPQFQVQSFTRTGNLLGTPQYMSPEQIQGHSQNIDHRSDLYSVGVLLFECVSGVLPFQGQSFGDLVIEHVMKEAPLLSEKCPEAPPALSAVLQRALQKKREDRFQSAEEMSLALREAEQSPTKAPTPAPSRSRLYLLGLFLLVGAAASLFFVFGASPTQPTREPAPASHSAPTMPSAPQSTSAPTTAPSTQEEIVTITLDSKPSGAQVIVVVDGKKRPPIECPASIQVPKGSKLTALFSQKTLRAQLELVATQNETITKKLSAPPPEIKKGPDKKPPETKDPGNGTIPFGGKR